MNTNSFPRWLNVVLGAWLFISAFSWPHGEAQFVNSWLIGIAMVIAAGTAIRYDGARYVNSVLAAWLFVSAWALPTFSTATFWNNVLVGVAAFIISLVPRTPTTRTMTEGPISQGPVSAGR